MSGTGWIPTRESDIKQPSDMIVAVDSNLYNEDLTAMPNAQKAGAVSAIGWSQPYPYLPSARSVAMEKERHNDRLNSVFVDAHAETIKREKLREASNEARQRWNNDHEPHPEMWVTIREPGN